MRSGVLSKKVTSGRLIEKSILKFHHFVEKCGTIACTRNYSKRLSRQFGRRVVDLPAISDVVHPMSPQYCSLTIAARNSGRVAARDRTIAFVRKEPSGII